MGDKLLDQIFNLKFTSKQLAKQSVRAEKDEKAEKLKVRRTGGGDGEEKRDSRSRRWPTRS